MARSKSKTRRTKSRSSSRKPAKRASRRSNSKSRSKSARKSKNRSKRTKASSGRKGYSYTIVRGQAMTSAGVKEWSKRCKSLGGKTKHGANKIAGKKLHFYECKT